MYKEPTEIKNEEEIRPEELLRSIGESSRKISIKLKEIGLLKESRDSKDSSLEEHLNYMKLELDDNELSVLKKISDSMKKLADEIFPKIKPNGMIPEEYEEKYKLAMINIYDNIKKIKNPPIRGYLNNILMIFAKL